MQKKTIIKEEGTSVQTYEEDVINTLIFAITKHFIGDPVYFQEITFEILNNQIGRASCRERV